MLRGPSTAHSPGSGRSAAADPERRGTADTHGHSPARSNRWRSRFGAVCPGRGTVAGLVLPFVNTAAMNAHLAEIARMVAPGAHAVLVLDGAGWHGSKPSMSPKTSRSCPSRPTAQPRVESGVNPVGKVWQFLRANWRAISVFDDYPAIPDACCPAWNRFADDPETVTSITERQRAKVNPSGRWYECPQSRGIGVLLPWNAQFELPPTMGRKLMGYPDLLH